MYDPTTGQATSLYGGSYGPRWLDDRTSHGRPTWSLNAPPPKRSSDRPSGTRFKPSGRSSLRTGADVGATGQCKGPVRESRSPLEGKGMTESGKTDDIVLGCPPAEESSSLDKECQDVRPSGSGPRAHRPETAPGWTPNGYSQKSDTGVCTFLVP